MKRINVSTIIYASVPHDTVHSIGYYFSYQEQVLQERSTGQQRKPLLYYILHNVLHQQDYIRFTEETKLSQFNKVERNTKKILSIDSETSLALKLVKENRKQSVIRTKYGVGGEKQIDFI